mmetsp:Transcript_17569/g.25655  ORF Transcript_17569/g.25655 Transcript_17569/m.25655 type:complete len:207 (+) Transcript_17569:693-1313(+)
MCNRMVLPLDPAAIAASHKPLSLVPSNNRAAGTRRTEAMIVSTEYRLAGVMFSPGFLVIICFEKIPRREHARLEPMAPPKLTQLNVNSFKEARPTPTHTGRRVVYTCHGKNCFKSTALRVAVKKGSPALTIWVKDTAPAPREITPVTWPSVCITATGIIVLTSSFESLGAFLSFKIHKGKKIPIPMIICAVATVHGAAKAFKAFLL